MHTPLAVVRQILSKFLRVGPLKGARLKPALVSEFERVTNRRFADTFWQYDKFSDFLNANDDLVEVSRPPGPGDVTVSLRQNETTEPTQAELIPASPKSQRFIRRPLWYAFTNPDPRRRRFVHRDTSEVVHFLTGNENGFGQQYASKVAADAAYVEITPISAAEQGAWMKEFIGKLPLNDSVRTSLRTIAEIPFSSEINRAFAASLGDYAEKWREFRTSKVDEHMHKWAEQVGMTLDGIVHKSPELSIDNLPVQPTATMMLGTSLSHYGEIRRLLHHAIDALDDEELRRVLLPASALTRVAGIGPQ
jgi:hypothetical protein